VERTPVTAVKSVSCHPINTPNGGYHPNAQTGIDEPPTALQMQTLCSNEIHIRQITPAKDPDQKADAPADAYVSEI
jgi:hypothetical protein